MLNPFTWLRELARASVVNGVADGIRDVLPDDQSPPQDLGELQARIADSLRVPMLPAATETKTVVKSAKK